MGSFEFILPAVARILAAAVALATIAHPMIVVASAADQDAAVCEAGTASAAPVQGGQPNDGNGDDQDDSSDKHFVTISTGHVWDRPVRSHHLSIVKLPTGPSQGPEGTTRVVAVIPIPPDAALNSEMRSRSETAAPLRPHAPPYLR